LATPGIFAQTHQSLRGFQSQCWEIIRHYNTTTSQYRSRFHGVWRDL